MFSRSVSHLRRPVLGASAPSLAGALAVAGCSSAADEAWKVVDPTGPEALATYRNLNSMILDDAFVIGLHGVEWTKRAEPDPTEAYLGGDPA